MQVKMKTAVYQVDFAMNARKSYPEYNKQSFTFFDFLLNIIHARQVRHIYCGALGFT